MRGLIRVVIKDLWCNIRISGELEPDDSQLKQKVPEITFIS